MNPEVEGGGVPAGRGKPGEGRGGGRRLFAPFMASEVQTNGGEEGLFLRQRLKRRILDSRFYL